MPFQIGDLVRCIVNSKRAHSCVAGQVYTVSAIRRRAAGLSTCYELAEFPPDYGGIPGVQDFEEGCFAAPLGRPLTRPTQDMVAAAHGIRRTYIPEDAEEAAREATLRSMRSKPAKNECPKCMAPLPCAYHPRGVM